MGGKVLSAVSITQGALIVINEILEMQEYDATSLVLKNVNVSATILIDQVRL